MVTLDGICAAYGESQVLYNVHLQVAPGESVTLLGRNGVGKTTLLRTVVGLHPVAGGSIYFGDEAIDRLPPYERARKGIGYVPQGRGIFPHLSVEENLRMGLAAQSERKSGAVPDRIYALFPALKRLRQRKAGVLSGGEQQQLAIGRALSAGPKLLLLDEPTEGIQPSIIAEIGEAIDKARAEFGIAVLLVEQYLEFAWALAERFYVMRGGRVVDHGDTRKRAPGSVAHLLTV